MALAAAVTLHAVAAHWLASQDLGGAGGLAGRSARLALAPTWSESPVSVPRAEPASLRTPDSPSPAPAVQDPPSPPVRAGPSAVWSPPSPAGSPVADAPPGVFRALDLPALAFPSASQSAAIARTAPIDEAIATAAPMQPASTAGRLDPPSLGQTSVSVAPTAPRPSRPMPPLAESRDRIATASRREPAPLQHTRLAPGPPEDAAERRLPQVEPPPQPEAALETASGPATAPRPRTRPRARAASRQEPPPSHSRTVEEANVSTSAMLARQRRTGANGATEGASPNDGARATGAGAGAGASQGAGVGSDGQGDGAGAGGSAGDYRAAVLRALARAKRYPRSALQRGREGRGILQLSIGARGKLLAARVVGSTGVGALDREIETMARRAAPFPPPPNDRFDAQIPVTFQLQ